MEDSNALLQNVSDETIKQSHDNQSQTLRHLVYATIIAGLSLFLFSRAGRSLPATVIGVSFTVIAVSKGFYAFQASRKREERAAAQVIHLVKSAKTMEMEAEYVEAQSRESFAWFIARNSGIVIYVSLGLILTLLAVTAVFGCALFVVYGAPLWGDALAQLIASALTIYVLSFWRGVIDSIRSTSRQKYRFRINENR